MKVQNDIIVQHFEGETTKGVKLTESEKQFLLYNKGHFEKSDDLIGDIKVFAANNYGLYVEHTDWRNVMNFVIQLFDGLIESGYISTHGKSPTQYLLEEILSDNLKRDDNSLLKFMMARMAYTNVEGMDLGEADYKYGKVAVRHAKVHG